MLWFLKAKPEWLEWINDQLHLVGLMSSWFLILSIYLYKCRKIQIPRKTNSSSQDSLSISIFLMYAVIISNILSYAIWDGFEWYAISHLLIGTLCFWSERKEMFTIATKKGTREAEDLSPLEKAIWHKEGVKWILEGAEIKDFGRLNTSLVGSELFAPCPKWELNSANGNALNLMEMLISSKIYESFPPRTGFILTGRVKIPKVN